MRIEVEIDPDELMDIIIQRIGEGVEDLEAAIRKLHFITIDAQVDIYDVASEVSDEWIKAQYEERFDSDTAEDRDARQAICALIDGDLQIAATLFDRAGDEGAAEACRGR